MAYSVNYVRITKMKGSDMKPTGLERIKGQSYEDIFKIAAQVPLKGRWTDDELKAIRRAIFSRGLTRDEYDAILDGYMAHCARRYQIFARFCEENGYWIDGYRHGNPIPGEDGFSQDELEPFESTGPSSLASLS